MESAQTTRGGVRKAVGARAPIHAWIVLLSGLAATAVGVYLLNDYTKLKNEQRAYDLVSQMNERLHTRMESYIELLRGGSGLFAANQFVTFEQFRSFWQRLQIPRHYAGMQGYGFTARIPPERLDSVVATMQQGGMTNFNVWPPGPRNEYHAIIYLEPPDARNRIAFGYDMFTEPVRRQAMEKARDTGEAIMSGLVTLVQEETGGPKQNGFLIYAPVYYGGVVPATVPERRQNLHGFVYSPFRAGDLLRGIYGTNLPGPVRLELYDGNNIAPEHFLSGMGPQPDGKFKEYRSTMEIGGRRWTVLHQVHPQFYQGNEFLIIFSALVGVVVSLFLFYVTRAEGIARRRAEIGTRQFREQSEWLQVMLGSIGDGVISTNELGEVEFMNPMAECLTGWRMDEAKQRPLKEVFDLVNGETRQVVENPAFIALRTNQIIKLSGPSVLIRKEGTELWIDNSAAPIRNASGKQIGAILTFRDISDRRQAERKVNAQHAVTRVLAEAGDLREAAEKVLQAICEHLDFTWGTFWLIDQEQGRAVFYAMYHLPNLQVPEFEQACRSFQPKPGEGLPGEAWQRLEPIWVENFSTDSRFPRAEVARLAGIQGALVFPVMREKQVFGILEFFSRDTRHEDLDLLSVSRGLGGQIGQFMERIRAEQGLQQSEELYRAITETAADGIVTIDARGNILAVNSAVERIFGYTREELLGANLNMLMPEKMRESHQAGVERFLQSGEREISWSAVELPGRGKDGRNIPLDISFGMTLRDGQPIFVGMLRDISRRREAEEQLRQSEERFRLLVNEAAEYAIITTDAEGRVSTWNAGAERIFRYTEEEILGRHLSQFFTDEDRTREVPEEEIRSATEQGQFVFERWLQRKDGSKFWASGSLIMLRGQDGAPRAYAKILRDITERKQAEEAVKELNQQLEERVQRRTAALQESNQQMEAFTYTVAHDLRAPLRAMQGFSQALLEDYAPHLDEPARDFIKRIMSSSQKMDALIQDLLAYSQLSRSDLTFEPVPVVTAMNEVLEQWREEIARTDAQVTVQGENVSVLAHQATFSHVLGNLLGNSLKFTQPGERPKVAVRVVERGETVQISFQDNGIGIAPEHHQRIFRVFERLHGQESYPGTGIGLAIVKKGIERMGGRVGLTSAPGEGSLFWIELPKTS